MFAVNARNETISWHNWCAGKKQDRRRFGGLALTPNVLNVQVSDTTEAKLQH